MKKLTSDLIINGEITCPLCGVASRLVVWDDYTVESCADREQRRAYVSLEYEKAYKRKTDVLYRCPNCGEFIDSHRLKVVLAK